MKIVREIFMSQQHPPFQFATNAFAWFVKQCEENPNEDRMKLYADASDGLSIQEQQKFEHLIEQAKREREKEAKEDAKK